MTGPRRESVCCLSRSGFHSVVYHEWGPSESDRVLLCVHGLTRNGRDFDDLAAALAAEGWRVVCPDVVGRGESDWLANPEDYAIPQYVADMTTLIARLGVERVDWLGTSMGGLIGMSLASLPNAPISRMIVNDVGPLIPKAALERIAAYLGAEAPRFPSLREAEAHLRWIHAPFGNLTDAQWARMAEQSCKPDSAGSVVFRYDPGIGKPMTAGPVEAVEIWPVWDAVSCPTLILRGAESDLLLAETADEMTRRGPSSPPSEVVEFAGCGHAPMLMDDEQIGAVRDWLAN